MSRIALIVPARLASTRFPRKLLHPIQGKPLILWTAHRLRLQAPDIPLWFAVGDQELADVLKAEGFQYVMTDPDLPSGTDRLAAANEVIKAETVINVQADEPLTSRAHIQQLLEATITHKDCAMATLAIRFESPEEFSDPNKVKVILNQNQQAIYFSRGTLPYPRDTKGSVDSEWLANHPVYLHLGLYAYRADFLRTYKVLEPTPLEQTEKLEQLRTLEKGYRIAVGVTEQKTVGIDTPEDALAYEKQLNES